MTSRKIEDVPWAHIPLKCVPIQYKILLSSQVAQIRNAHQVMRVIELTIEWRSFITLINTKQSFVHLIQSEVSNVITKNFAPSPTQRKNYRWTLLKTQKLIWISIFFILKQYGVRIEKMIMRERYVYMHIIGKTTDVSHPRICIPSKCVPIGKQITLYQHMMMGASYNTIAAILMAGKNKNIIQSSSRQGNANMVRHAPNHIVHIGTRTRTRSFR